MLKKGFHYASIVAVSGLLSLHACKNEASKPAAVVNNPPVVQKTLPKNPAERFGALFDTVQRSGIFPDSKTFVDYTAKGADADIMAAFARERTQPKFDLKKFVETHFDAPPQYSGNYKTDLTQNAEQHISELWTILGRKPDVANAGSSLLPLPNPYIVPGGRFREIYYWDSYFTMLGLAADGKTDVIENMIANFAHLIDEYGFIPNGSRTYYLTRSQPPFFACMVNLLAENKKDSAILVKYLPEMQREYDFWMNSARHEAVSGMNRYCDNGNTPRPEGYKEDMETVKKALKGADTGGGASEKIYKHLRSGAESGWDYSSRWFADGKNIATIETTDILPVDLNALLYNLEFTLARAYRINKNEAKANALFKAAEARKKALTALCYDPTQKMFFDYNFVKKQRTNKISAAALFPLFFNMATPEQAKGVMDMTQKQLLRAGGIVSTPYKTGQQWDAPNGWAPLQWVAIKGLRNYGFNDLSNEIKTRWTNLNVKIYQKTGKMLEKYNVEDLSLLSGGGEYPVQDGFGWTNGVLKQLLSENKK